MSKVKAGFVGFGIVDYPRDLIERKRRQGLEWLQSSNIEVIDAGLATDNPNGEDVRRAIAELSHADVDLLVACVAGWIPSQVVINVLSEFRHLPILLWGLAGNWEGGRLVTTADQAGTTALRRAMEDLGFNFKYLPSFQDAPPPLDKVTTFARAAAGRKTTAPCDDRGDGIQGHELVRHYV